MYQILQKINVNKQLLLDAGKILLIAELFYGNVLYGIPFLVLLIPINRRHLAEAEREKIELAGKQFADALNSIAFAVEVGYSMENAISEACKDMEVMHGKNSLIYQQLWEILNKIKVNIPIEKAFSDMAEAVDNEDIKYFAQVFSLAKRTGGNLVSILNNTARRINKKIEVKTEINTIISGKKMEQKIMSAIPFVIVMYLRVTAPEFVTPLYGNITGMAVMTVCLAIIVGADFIARYMLAIGI